MPKLVIDGGKRLSGSIAVQGAKNSILPVLAATVLCHSECIIHNCPELSDVETSVQILEVLGCKCTRDGTTLTVNASAVNNCTIPDSLMRQMRSSVVFLGAVLGRLGSAVISSPGGCELGPRPIDLHLSALKKLGVTIDETHGNLSCKAENGLVGCEIDLSFPSVGATENIILAAATARGVTVIHNAAKEPEISDLADFLNSAGARIYGGGSDSIVIYGVDRLSGAEHTIIPDRIVGITYMTAAAITGGNITLEGFMPSHIVSVISRLREAGCEIKLVGKNLVMNAPKRLNRVPTVRTLVYPGFPTDAGPMMISLLSVANGTSVFVENIFENRYNYISELNRLGTKIKTEGRVAVIEGVPTLSAASCECTDLRGGAALVVAALSANGTTNIDKIHHIKRGYADIVGALSSLGADIKEEE